LKNYVISRKTFDSTLDSRAVVAEFNRKFFGSKAGALVTQYNTLLDKAMAAAPTVNSSWPPSAIAPGRHGPYDPTSAGGPGYSPFSTIFPNETICPGPPGRSSALGGSQCKSVFYRTFCMGAQGA
jgi:hypothetical protein